MKNYELVGNAIIRLSSVSRYSQLHLTKSENIAEHCMHTTFIAKVFYYELTDEDKSKINIGKCISYLTTHDFPEIFTGDIPRPTKYSHPDLKKLLDELEYNLVSEFTKELNIKNETNLINDILGYDLTESERKFVKLVDIYTVYIKFYNELIIGNTSVLTESKNCMDVVNGYTDYKYIIEKYIDPIKEYIINKKVN